MPRAVGINQVSRKALGRTSMIHVQCKCGGSFHAQDEFAGKRGRCPRCSSVMIIGQSSLPPVLPVAPTPTSGSARNESIRCSQCGGLSEIASFTCSFCGASLSRTNADEFMPETLVESESRSVLDGVGKFVDLFDVQRKLRKEAMQLPDSPEDLVSHFSRHVGGVSDNACGDIHYQACEAALTKLRVFSLNNPRLTRIVEDLQKQLDGKPRQWEVTMRIVVLTFIPIVLLGVVGGVIAIVGFVFSR